MNCTEAQKLIYLSVGGDIRSEEQSALGLHLRDCDACSTEQVSAVRAMDSLTSLRSVDFSGRTSVWPAVLSGIRQTSCRSRTIRRFNLQVAALSVCSLAIALVTIVQTLTAMREDALISDRVQLAPFWQPAAPAIDPGAVEPQAENGEAVPRFYPASFQRIPYRSFQDPTSF